MKVRIIPRAILQYILIYLLMICHDAGIYRNNALSIRYFIIALCVVILIILRIKIPKSVMFYGLFVVGIMQILGFIHGDAQFTNEMHVLLEHLIVAYTAFAVNKDRFVPRFLKATVFFSVISLIFFTLANTVPEYLESILTSEYKLAWAGSYEVEAKGWLFYVYRAFEPDRNNGIFTEPGVFQILLSAAIYILLFCNEQAQINKRSSFWMLIVLIVTMITTASTSGYLSMSLVLLLGAMQNKMIFPNSKMLRVVFLMFCAVFCLDLAFNDENSMLWNIVFNKFEGMDSITDGFISSDSVAGSSAMARMAILFQAVPTMLANPLGFGFTSFYELLATLYSGQAAGARLLVYFSAMGLIPALCLLFPLFRRSFQHRTSWYSVVSYVFLFLNAGFSQSKAIYAGLAVLPFILEHQSMRIREAEKERLESKAELA